MIAYTLLIIAITSAVLVLADRIPGKWLERVARALDLDTQKEKP